MSEFERLKTQKEAIIAKQSIGLESIRGAVARGWTRKPNTRKVMDTDLAEAISQEVLALLNGGQRVRVMAGEGTRYALVRKRECRDPK